MKPDDVQIVHAIRSGDSTAFTALVEKYKKAVYCTVKYVLTRSRTCESSGQLHANRILTNSATCRDLFYSAVLYGRVLVEQGVITLCPDNAGMGERTHPNGGCDFLWRRLNLLGYDLTGYRVYDHTVLHCKICSDP